jgi:hypothetical protein
MLTRQQRLDHAPGACVCTCACVHHFGDSRVQCTISTCMWCVHMKVARMRELQGATSKATELRALAEDMVAQTIDVMYEKGKGYFNLVHPRNATTAGSGGGAAAATTAGGGGGGEVDLTVLEMRHVVDFFSIIFGENTVRAHAHMHITSFSCADHAKFENHEHNFNSISNINGVLTKHQVSAVLHTQIATSTTIQVTYTRTHTYIHTHCLPTTSCSSLFSCSHVLTAW